MFNFLKDKLSKNSASEPATIEGPIMSPGWNLNAEEYFQDKLQPLAGKRINVTLALNSNPDFDETVVLFGGSKIAQLPPLYHQPMKSALSKLESNGLLLSAVAEISKDLQAKLLLPYPMALIQWLDAPPQDRHLINLQKVESSSIRLKEQGKFQDALVNLRKLGGAKDWQGTCELQIQIEDKGKYQGQSKIVATIDGAVVGTVGARYKTEEAELFQRVAASTTLKLECRISKSQFDDDLYCTVFLPQSPK